SERGSHTAPRPVHPIEPRCITAREAARLHGFPDWFVFYPGKWHSYQQIGNAVCPPVAKVAVNGLPDSPSSLARLAEKLSLEKVLSDDAWKDLSLERVQRNGD